MQALMRLERQGNLNDFSVCQMHFRQGFLIQPLEGPRCMEIEPLFGTAGPPQTGGRCRVGADCDLDRKFDLPASFRAPDLETRAFSVT
jgi:hypothetical protein